MARWLRGSDIFCFRFALTELPNLFLAYENRRVAYHVGLIYSVTINLGSGVVLMKRVEGLNSCLKSFHQNNTRFCLASHFISISTHVWLSPHYSNGSTIRLSELVHRILRDLVETSWEHQQLPQLTSTTILPCNSEITNLGAITASRSGAEYPNFTAHQIQVPEQGGTILLFLTAPAALANSIQAHQPIPLALVPGSVEWVTGQVIATSTLSWAYLILLLLIYLE